MSDAVYTTAGMRRGARAILPLAPGGFLFGVSYGLLAAEAGLSVAETAAMSLSVYAGASQYLAVELWQEPLPVVSIVIATLVVNARHLLMGAVWRPGCATCRGDRCCRHCSSWSTRTGASPSPAAKAPPEQRERDLGFLLGGGLPLYALWTTGSLLGHAAAGQIADPRAYGLDALAGAVFLVLLSLQWRGPRCLFPWAVAAGVALAVQSVLPIAWSVLLGALAGSIAGALAHDR